MQPRECIHSLPAASSEAGCSSHDTGRWHPRWQLCTLQQSLLQSMPEHRLLVPQGVGHTGRHYPRSTVPFLGKESTSIRRQKPTWDNFSLTRDIVIDRKLLFQERQMISTRAVQAISKWVLCVGGGYQEVEGLLGCSMDSAHPSYLSEPRLGRRDAGSLPSH